MRGKKKKRKRERRESPVAAKFKYILQSEKRKNGKKQALPIQVLVIQRAGERGSAGALGRAEEKKEVFAVATRSQKSKGKERQIARKKQKVTRRWDGETKRPGSS